jgi:alpha-L-fucosidase
MKKYKSFGIFVLSFILLSCSNSKYKDNSAFHAPEQYRKPYNYKTESYQYSLSELKDRFSEKMMKRATEAYKQVQQVNKQGKWKPTPESIDQHQAPEWFIDAKFGMFIDWGPWSVAGWAPKKDKGAMYPDWYEFRLDTDSTFMAYHERNWGKEFFLDDFIPLFQAREYCPEKLVSIAKEAGMKYIIPFCKHHGGFCLWPSSFTQRDVSEMGPKKDLIKPLVESCNKEGLKFGFYFSIEEWEYPLINNNGNLQQRIWNGTIKPFDSSLENKCSGKVAVRDFGTDYLVPQATEFIDKYDPDLVWYDGDWNTHIEELHTYDIAAYFYNNAEGRKQVAVNDRYGPPTGDKSLRSKRGDFFTNEYGDMEKEAKQTIHSWEECRGISQSYGFNWQDTEENVISSKTFVDMFIDIVAHGGNLLLVVNLDSNGALPLVQEKRLKEIGKWLSVNGEGIYSSRTYKILTNGSVSYTQSKNGQYLYAIIKEWPGRELFLDGIQAPKTNKIKMLGCDELFEWENTGKGLMVRFPNKLQNEKKRPCEHAWIVRIEKFKEK